jgi:predicted pyridoxine 5'-phosphate oxidase superfamily flavin-nucleotide-binding protein
VHDPCAIASVAAPEALYDAPLPLPLPLSLAKVRRDLDQPSRDFIARSPFCVLATRAADGRLHATPRGDAPGFVAALS